jgi:hypothetical protein
MNAMLEPRIVAESIHGRDVGAHAGDRTAVVVNVSVHGCFISIPMLTGQEWIPSWNTREIFILPEVRTEIASTTSLVITIALAYLGTLVASVFRSLQQPSRQILTPCVWIYKLPLAARL